MGGLYYQAEAPHIADYNLWKIDGCEEFFRGPQMVLSKGKYITYLGAAQTFGTFCRFPFPSLVGERIGGGVANLGIGGAGPDRFLLEPKLIDVANGGGAVVVQVMSGRSTPNRLYENLNGTSSLRLRGSPSGRWVWAEGVWAEIFKTMSVEEISNLIQDSRQNWLESMQKLLKSITVPKVLFWFSTRTPKHEFSMESAQKALGPFPQFVDDSMMNQLTPLADAYVEVVSSRGMPQKLFDRWSGSATVVNRLDYSGVRLNHSYPSPEMHVDAAEALAPCLQKLLK